MIILRDKPTSLTLPNTTEVIVVQSQTVVPIIPTASVTNAKLATMANATLKGNDSGATANPQDLTVAEVKTMLALENVENTTDLDKPISADTQTALDTKADASALALKSDASALASHTGNTSNPHGVTASQVGLGNVNNTSDADKPISTATQTALNAKQNSLGFTPENSANKGQLNGYASLDGTGKVPASELPSYVDDVVEYADLASFPVTGSTGIIYIAISPNNLCYRWTGTVYIEVSPTPDLSGYVPYTGATSDVNLATHKITLDGLQSNDINGITIYDNSGVAKADLAKSGTSQFYTNVYFTNGIRQITGNYEQYGPTSLGIYRRYNDDTRTIIGSYVDDGEGVESPGVTRFVTPTEVVDEAYGAGWNGKTEIPTKNALYDIINTLAPASGFVPYTGATGNVNLGVYSITADTATIKQAVTNATIIGDITGNTRGSGALDIQPARSGVTKVASGANSQAVGYNNSTSGANSSSFGSNLTNIGDNNYLYGGSTSSTGSYNATCAWNSTSTGNGNSQLMVNGVNSTSYGVNIGLANNSSSGNYQTNIGTYNTTTGDYSLALGEGNKAIATGAVSIGRSQVNNTANTLRIGNAVDQYIEMDSTGKVITAKPFAVNGSAINEFTVNASPNRLTTIVPVMTSNTAPSGTVTAESTYVSCAAWKAFNASKNLTVYDNWMSNGTGVPTWLQYQFTTGKTVTGYAVTSRISEFNRSPQAWQFQGSNDGVAWTTLDSQTGQTGWTSLQRRPFSFANTTSYTYYRLYMTTQGSDAYVGIGFLEMFEPAVPLFDVSSTQLTAYKPIVLPTEAYGALWDGKLEAPTKDALYGIISTLATASGYVPYTGATANVDLGTQAIRTDKITASSANGLSFGSYGSGTYTTMLDLGVGNSNVMRFFTANRYYSTSGSTLRYMYTTLQLDGYFQFGLSNPLNAQSNYFEFLSKVKVPDDPYSISWNGDLSVPTKNSVIGALLSFFPTAYGMDYYYNPVDDFMVSIEAPLAITADGTDGLAHAMVTQYENTDGYFPSLYAAVSTRANGTYQGVNIRGYTAPSNSLGTTPIGNIDGIYPDAKIMDAYYSQNPGFDGVHIWRRFSTNGSVRHKSRVVVGNGAISSLSDEKITQTVAGSTLTLPSADECYSGFMGGDSRGTYTIQNISTGNITVSKGTFGNIDGLNTTIVRPNETIVVQQTGEGTPPALRWRVQSRTGALGDWGTYAAKTADYTATLSDRTIHYTSGSFTVTLPTAASAFTNGQGLIYNIKNSGAGIITVDGNASETIDGLLTQTVNAGSSMTIQATGTQWIII